MHSNFQVVAHSFFKFGILATICRLKLHMYDAFVQKKLHWGQFQKEKREQVSLIHFLWSASLLSLEGRRILIRFLQLVSSLG